MTVTRFDKILAAIEKHDGIATKTDIKCSIAKFNQAGGADELEKILADMVAQGILFEHLHEAGNNKIFKFYRSRNSNAIRANPIQGDDINMYATINLTNKGRDFARELVELLAARINAGGLMKSFVVPANTDKESTTPDFNEVPFDLPESEIPCPGNESHFNPKNDHSVL